MGKGIYGERGILKRLNRNTYMTTSVSNISTIIGIKYNLISPTAIINTITYPNVKISQLASTINNLFTSYGSGQTNYVTIPIKMSDLYLTLNNLTQAYTVVGRATGTSQIVGMCLVQTLTINNILTIRNPAGNSTALTITPLAGGASSVSAHLVITRIN